MTKGNLLGQEDYSGDEYNGELGGRRLAECRKALNLTQAQLAAKAGLNQVLVSNMENGKFCIPSRDKVWRTIRRLQLEQMLKKSPPPPSLLGLGRSSGPPKTPSELAAEEITALKERCKALEEEASLARQLLDMDLVVRCADLEKQLAEAREANAEYAKLFALKGAAMAANEAADELQQQVEERLQRENQTSSGKKLLGGKK